MIDTLAYMEPRCEEQGKLIYDQLEEVNEFFFIQKGCIDIGFRINSFSKYVVRMNPKKSQVVIGAYNCIFDKKTLFLYKCFQRVQGYFIRKKYWRILEENYPKIVEQVKENVTRDYTNQIKTRV